MAATVAFFPKVNGFIDRTAMLDHVERAGSGDKVGIKAGILPREIEFMSDGRGRNFFRIGTDVFLGEAELE